MLKSLTKRPPLCSRRRRRRSGRADRAAEVCLGQGVAVDEFDHQHACAGLVVDNPGTHSGRSGDDRIAVLGLPIDGQQVDGPGRNSKDVGALGRDDLVVVVGQATGQLTDLGGGPETAPAGRGSPSIGARAAPPRPGPRSSGEAINATRGGPDHAAPARRRKRSVRQRIGQQGDQRFELHVGRGHDLGVRAVQRSGASPALPSISSAIRLSRVRAAMIRHAVTGSL